MYTNILYEYHTKKFHCMNHCMNYVSKKIQFVIKFFLRNKPTKWHNNVRHLCFLPCLSKICTIIVNNTIFIFSRSKVLYFLLHFLRNVIYIIVYIICQLKQICKHLTPCLTISNSACHKRYWSY